MILYNVTFDFYSDIYCIIYVLYCRIESCDYLTQKFSYFLRSHPRPLPPPTRFLSLLWLFKTRTKILSCFLLLIFFFFNRENSFKKEKIEDFYSKNCENPENDEMNFHRKRKKRTFAKRDHLRLTN